MLCTGHLIRIGASVEFQFPISCSNRGQETDATIGVLYDNTYTILCIFCGAPHSSPNIRNYTKKNARRKRHAGWPHVYSEYPLRCRMCSKNENWVKSNIVGLRNLFNQHKSEQEATVLWSQGWRQGQFVGFQCCYEGPSNPPLSQRNNTRHTLQQPPKQPTSKAARSQTLEPFPFRGRGTRFSPYPQK